MKLNRKAIVAAAIIASAASFSAPSAFAAGADSFSDVPKDHWAYEAPSNAEFGVVKKVYELLEKGLI